MLELFSVDKPEWGVREVARQLGVPKSSAHQLLASLADIGFLERTGSARYRLGWRLLDMSRVLVHGAAFRPHAVIAMKRIARDVPGVVRLSVWDRDALLCIAAESANGRPGGSGVRTGAAGDAAGEILMAHRSDRTFTPIDDHREAVRRQPCVTVVRSPCAASVAVPIRDVDGAVVAALSIHDDADTIERLRGRLAATLTVAARQVERAAREDLRIPGRAESGAGAVAA